MQIQTNEVDSMLEGLEALNVEIKKLENKRVRIGSAFIKMRDAMAKARASRDAWNKAEADSLAAQTELETVLHSEFAK